MSENITQREVAQASGRALKTVSLALSDSPLVSPETKRQIMQIADELGYRHVGARSGRIGLIARGFGHLNVDILEAVHLHASTLAGYNIEFRLTGGHVGAELNAIIELDHSQVEGIIMVTPSVSQPRLLPFVTRTRPIVSINTEYEPRPGLDSVAPDNLKAARGLVEMLIAKGHRYFAFLCGPTSNSDARRRGCDQALEEAGLPPMQVYPASDNELGMEAGYRTCRQLLETHVARFPTAVICYNDLYALGALKRMKEGGIDVPRDVSVAGFGDYEFSQYASPSLTTVGLSTNLLGKIGVQKLLHLMGSAAEPSQASEGFDVQIRSRESTAAAPDAHGC